MIALKKVLFLPPPARGYGVAEVRSWAGSWLRFGVAAHRT
jgi:hypothetical protein